ncbi:MAG: BtpA/SgcQ family protein [Planctomycetota bacterium]|nr:BtpA/SgcQ family protein [Planctomycetota bacterium]
MAAVTHRLTGAVHLLPLPGSPRYGGDMDAIVARAVADARAYGDGGADAVIVENYGDAPFYKRDLAPVTVAAMARCAAAVRAAVSLPLGVNALRNDARAALGIAVACGAQFIRVNVHAGVVASDQGLIEGDAANTLRERARLGASVAIWADIHVKHARPLYASDLAAAARDLTGRAGADALIVSGGATGSPVAPADLEIVRRALPDRPLLAGSGVTAATAAAVLKIADGAIVGTALKHGGDVSAAVDAERVRAFVAALNA